MLFRSAVTIKIPSVPSTLARVIEVAQSPDDNLHELASVVLADPLLSERVLRLANSATFCRREKAETINDAILVLGSGYVRNLAASVSVLNVLCPDQIFPGFNWRNMWRHCVVCAVASESIYSWRTGWRRGTDESAFVAGLLHDIGKMLISKVAPKKFKQAIELCQERRIDMLEAEMLAMGTNHAIVGRQLAEKWEFPEKPIAGIGWHHDPASVNGYADVAFSVCAGNMLAKRIEDSYIYGYHPYIRLTEIADIAGLDISCLNMVIDETRIGILRCSEVMSWGNGLDCYPSQPGFAIHA
ncbi:MAG: HDOD domain-containing protein [Armatimonadota bacterium]|nr:HDOD domain-containing protein [bacterium]